MASLIKYPDNIREMAGIDTVIFSYNAALANLLHQNLSNDFSIIQDNLDRIDSDHYEWIEDALYRSHILIIDNNSNNFIIGFLASMALSDNPIQIITYNLSKPLMNFIDIISKNSATHFDLIEPLMKEINEY